MDNQLLANLSICAGVIVAISLAFRAVYLWRDGRLSKGDHLYRLGLAFYIGGLAIMMSNLMERTVHAFALNLAFNCLAVLFYILGIVHQIREHRTARRNIEAYWRDKLEEAAGQYAKIINVETRRK